MHAENEGGTGKSYSINSGSPIAVYVQIENQIRFAIASERLKSGDTLPSVREMSTMLDINPNTVTKAYRDLELLGLLNTKRGVGVTVTEGALELCKDSTHETVTSHLKDAVAECIATGIQRKEIERIVGETIVSDLLPYSNNG
ncbi:MAG: GntR family transcriptional regulator [Candidatus Hydrogenedentes bacterium]|nr:GntR family transcriptional regulator [Candidatus Hydrogenedentota bacterium]